MSLALATSSPLTTPNYTELDYASLADAFPAVDPGLAPMGFMGVFQIRHTTNLSKGGIILVEESTKTQHYNTQVAKVISLGPLCFKTVKEVGDGINFPKKDVLVDWPEGQWFKPGDYVRVPRYGGDRLAVPFEHPKTGKGQIVFAMFKVKDILGLVPDPLSVMAYID